MSGDFSGLRDQFLECRFQDTGQLNVQALAAKGAIAFLSTATQMDEIYEVSGNPGSLAPGLYRIRNEGSSELLLTQKRYATGAETMAETVDVLHARDETIDANNGQSTKSSTSKAHSWAGCSFPPPMPPGRGGSSARPAGPTRNSKSWRSRSRRPANKRAVTTLGKRTGLPSMPGRKKGLS
jgi:hypothetical protein